MLKKSKTNQQADVPSSNGVYRGPTSAPAPTMPGVLFFFGLRDLGAEEGGVKLGLAGRLVRAGGG